MRRLSVLRKTLGDLRWQVFWYGVGLALLAMLDVYVYPSYSDQLANMELPEAMRALIGNADYATPEGFLAAEFFSWAPILGVIFAIMAGTSVLAGEEANGTLDLVLAQPISRVWLSVQKIAGLVLGCAGVSALICAGWLLSVPFVDIEVSYARLFMTTVAAVPLLLFFATLAVWLSAALPGRGLATGVATGAAVASFVVNFLGTLVDGLAPLRWASIFNYYRGSELLTSYGELWRLAVPLTFSVAFACLAVASFQRREIGIRQQGFKLRFFRRPADWPQRTKAA